MRKKMPQSGAPAKARPTLGWTLVLGAAPLLWGAAFPGIKIALQDYHPTQIAVLRILIGALLLLALHLIRPLSLPRARDLPLVIAVGFLGFPAYQILTNLGLQTAPAGSGSILIALVPLLSALFTLWWFREPLGPLAWVGIPLAILGVWTIVYGQTGTPLPSFNSGFGFLLVATLVAGLYFALEKRLMQTYDARSALTWTMIAGSLFVLPLTPGVPSAVTHAGLHAQLALAYLVIFPTVVAFGIMAWGLAKSGTSEATSFIFLAPVFAFLVAWPLLSETPLWTDAAGGALCVAGVWLVNRRPRTTTTAPPPTITASPTST